MGCVHLVRTHPYLYYPYLRPNIAIVGSQAKRQTLRALTLESLYPLFLIPSHARKTKLGQNLILFLTRPDVPIHMTAQPLSQIPTTRQCGLLPSRA